MWKWWVCLKQNCKVQKNGHKKTVEFYWGEEALLGPLQETSKFKIWNTQGQNQNYIPKKKSLPGSKVKIRNTQSKNKRNILESFMDELLAVVLQETSKFKIQNTQNKNQSNIFRRTSFAIKLIKLFPHLVIPVLQICQCIQQIKELYIFKKCQKKKKKTLVAEKL